MVDKSFDKYKSGNHKVQHESKPPQTSFGLALKLLETQPIPGAAGSIWAGASLSAA